MFVGLAGVLVFAYLLYEGFNAKGEERTRWLGIGVIVLGASIGLIARGWGESPARDAIFTRLDQPVNAKQVLAFGLWAAGALLVYAALTRARTLLFSSFWALAVSFALWMSWSHWVNLSHHWTQRDQFWRYYEQRKPGEPIAAFLMNWRGETFYSQNTVKQIREIAKLPPYLALPGRKWALVEHHRLEILQQYAQGMKVTTIDPGLNDKFVLVTIE